MTESIREEHWRQGFAAGDREAGLRLGELMQGRGDVGHAQEILRHAGSGLGPVAARALFALGMSLTHGGHLHEASDAFEGAAELAQAESAPDVVLNLAARWTVLGREDDAEAAYWSVVEKAPDAAERAVAAYRLGRYCRDVERFAEGVGLLRRAVEEGTEDLVPFAKLELARALREQSNQEECEVLYRDVIRSDHPDRAPEAAVALAELHLARDEIVEARHLLELVVESEHPDWTPVAKGRLDAMAQKQLTNYLVVSCLSPVEHRRVFVSHSRADREQGWTVQLAVGNPHGVGLASNEEGLARDGSRTLLGGRITFARRLSNRQLVISSLRHVVALARAVRRVLTHLLRTPVAAACELAGSARTTASLERRLRAQLIRHGLTAAEAARAVSFYAGLCARGSVQSVAARGRPARSLWRESTSSLRAHQGPLDVARSCVQRVRWYLARRTHLRGAQGFGCPSPRMGAHDRALLRSSFGAHIAMSAPGTGKSLLALHLANLVQHQLADRLQNWRALESDEGLSQDDGFSWLALDVDDPGVTDWHRCQMAIEHVFGAFPATGFHPELGHSDGGCTCSAASDSGCQNPA